MNKMEYCNEIMVRLEELFFHELSGGAAWKVELVGVDFIQSKEIKGNTRTKYSRIAFRKLKPPDL